MIAEDLFYELLVNDIIGIFTIPDLVENHLLLLHLGRIIDRVLQNVAQDIYRCWELFIQHMNIEAGQLFACEGIDAPAAAFNLSWRCPWPSVWPFL